ncbi:hypothetical protein TUM4249_28670 [Shewanella sp. KT0246]|nr:hypothetical protein TUM4249_28670 [Shewanella sp. KT0246]
MSLLSNITNVTSLIRFVLFENFRTLLFICCVLFGLFLSPHSYSATVESLIDTNQLTLDIRMKTTGPFIVKQPIVIQVEVATPRWFAKGIQVTPPAFNDIVFLPITGSAITGTKKVNGASWSYLIREITLYPMHLGAFELPAFQVFVSVNTENDGVVEGVINTAGFEFTALMPKGITELGYSNDLSLIEEKLIVSSKVDISVSQTVGNEPLDKIDLKRSFKVGDAVTQTINISAKDVPAMMLPVLEHYQVEGLSIYQQPTQLNDRTNRGALTGTAKQTSSYIFETSGVFNIPKQIIYWYNTDKDNVIELVVPAMSWSVGGAAKNNNKDRSAPLLPNEITIGLIAIGLLSIFLLLKLGVFQTASIKKYYLSLTQNEVRQLKLQLRKQYHSGDYTSVCLLLYRYFQLKTDYKIELNLNYKIAPNSAIESHEQTTVVNSLRKVFNADSHQTALIERLLSQAYSEGDTTPMTTAEFEQLLAYIPVNNTYQYFKPSTKSSYNIDLN